MVIGFNVPFLAGRELEYMTDVLTSRRTAGNGRYTKLAQDRLSASLGGAGTLLTTSCTAALEMAMLLLDLAPGDEVIMPSFTFASTANAVVLRGAVPVFVDVRPDTMNIDERLIEAAITPRSRAICVVHYAGVGCEMDAIRGIADAHRLAIVEDAAQGLYADYRGRPLGTLGSLAAFSFHETKNIACGEGGALVVNDPDLIERAEIIWEKGTDRGKFIRGEVDKYTWVDVGSSFLPSEFTAAFLLAQLEQGEAITERRLSLWTRYHQAFADLEAGGRLSRPRPPAHCRHNGHIYYLLARDAGQRGRWLSAFGAQGVNAIFHYIPLHSSPAGRKYGRTAGALTITEEISDRLLRLPLHLGLTPEEQERVIEAVYRNCV